MRLMGFSAIALVGLGGTALAQDQESTTDAMPAEPAAYATSNAADTAQDNLLYARTAQTISRKAQIDATEEETAPRRLRNSALVIDDAVIVGTQQNDTDPN
jgi:hypothetical protein